ncbi:MAG: hypothetical protein JW952_08410, partial [Candidatus Eisenbacteria bacterium]|nr:hypothetical protein [Candidatus Eisenbacteria bacterium]
MNRSRDIPAGEFGSPGSNAQGAARGQFADESTPRSVIASAILLLGFTATSSQIFLLREFISTFHGNELVIGIYMSVWLLATAVGSGPLHALLARASLRGERRSGSVTGTSPLLLRFAVVQALAAAGLLFAAVGLMAPPAQLRPAPGEVVGLVTALACSAVFLSPFCLLQGLLFPLGATLVRRGSGAAYERAAGQGSAVAKSGEPGAGSAASVSRVYFLEAVGAAAGGLLLSLLLVRVLGSFRIAAVLASVNLLAAAVVSYR